MVNVIRNKSRISLDSLEFLISVASSGSISAAARKWNISPSLATRKIAALESELNAHLFDRTTRRIHLTDSGRKALNWAMEVVESHHALADELGLIRQQLAGLIRIVANEYLITAVLPKFIAGFSERFPDIRFALSATDSPVTTEQRDYDVAIYSGQIPDSSLKGVRIRNFKRILCAAPAYLKRSGPLRRLEDLAAHACLVHRQAQDGVWVFKRGGRLIRQRINPVALSESHLPLIQLAKCGMGIIQVSRGAVHAELESGELTGLLTEYEGVNPDGSQPATWAVFPGDRKLARIRLFVTELTQYLRALPG
ncbi:MAG: LysR family transcriptional regulator [Burkholderiales bacterium]|nr:LysR family transcriptional regulator [Burkholderiales bacterium]